MTTDSIAQLLREARAYMQRSDPEFAAKLEAAAASLEAQEPVAWNYCPECGSDDHAHLGGEGFFCQNCGQEWFPDVDYTDAVKNNLSNRHPPSSAVPEGWKLVPVEPTSDMRQIGGEVNSPTTTLTTASLYAVEVYRAMLAAAPQQGGSDDE